jgi:hypothetical protein
MSPSIRTKAQKTESSVDIPAALDPSISELERAVLRIMESNFSGVAEESERVYWTNIFKNIATSLSLALSECRGGPRHFHNHYRHSEHDDAILKPVLEPCADMLAHACEKALRECSEKLVGLHEECLIKKQRMLEAALRQFLEAYASETQPA